MIREIQDGKGDDLMALFGIRWSRVLPCAALSALVVLAAAGCGDRVPTTDHILLITIDTIRADHLGCYGYPAADTPVIDDLASESLLFENAFSTYPLTLPSHASMLTGQLPFEHGLRNNDLIRRDETESMLQEILQARGFGTSAVVSAFVLDSSFGLSRGFDRYVDDFRPDGPQERRADEVTDIALELLDELGDEPFFLWVHYFDPHHPYGDQGAPPIEGYDEEITFVDTQIGRLLESLQDRNLYENTAIAIVGDHGEAFGEHGESEHGYFIYDTTIQVPLILRLPGGDRGGTRPTTPVSITDLFPTILQLAGAPVPTREHASSLLSPPDRALYAETLSPFANDGAAPLASARQNGWKYIEAPEPELYDTANDPAELNNLHQSMPDRSARLRAKLSAMNDLAWMTSADPLRDVTTDPATRERLAALGYVSSDTRGQSRWRPDPKLLLRMKADIERGDRASARGDLDEAESAYRSVLEQQPTNWKATWKLGDLLRNRGDDEAAARVYEGVTSIEPGNFGARIRLATIRLDQGRLSEALEQLDICVAGAPGYVRGRLLRARVLDGLGRVAEARVELETVLQLDPSNAEAQRILRELE